MNDLIDRWREITTDDRFLNSGLAKPSAELKASFSSRIELNSLGFRGPMGPGTAFINVHTIAALGKSYALFLNQRHHQTFPKRVAIVHDNRTNSALYAQTLVRVLAAQNIEATLVKDNVIAPSSLLSFVIVKMQFLGGLSVTAAHAPKNYNGVKIFNEHGAQASTTDVAQIANIMHDINPIDVEQAAFNPTFLPGTIEDEYLNAIKTRIMSKDLSVLADNKKLKVVFSPLHGAGFKLGQKLLQNLGFDAIAVQKQISPDEEFSHTKSSDPQDGRAYNKAVFLARRKHADMAAVMSSDGSRSGFVVRYKRRYKYLNGNEAAAIYLDFYLSQVNAKKQLLPNSFIVKSKISGDLVDKICAKYGVKVYASDPGFAAVAQTVLAHSKDENFIFAFEESMTALIDINLTHDSDGLQMLGAFASVCAALKKADTSPFRQLRLLQNEHGIYRTIIEKRDLDKGIATRLMERMVGFKEVNGKTVTTITDGRIRSRVGADPYLAPTPFVKVGFADGSWFAIRKALTGQIFKIYVQSAGKPNEGLTPVVIKEKETLNFIDDNCETLPVKHFSWKTFFKYLLFIAIVAGTLSVVFTTIYTSGAKSLYENASEIFSHQSRWIWLSTIGFVIFNLSINAFSRKRLIDFQGQRVKMRHLLIASVMGIVISYITPFTIGGDAIGYWYLRRKGFKRGPLISSFITSTIIYQFGILLQTAILVPVGVPIYSQILWSSSGPQGQAALTLFIIGLVWNVFATFMIFTLTLSRRFQEFIISIATKFFEWVPFIHFYDPGKVASRWQYEFSEMRNGMHKIWKRKRLLLEITFYELFPRFLVGTAIITWSAGVIKENLELGPYFSQIVANDIIGTANSMSLLPGGALTGEWLTVTINNFIMKNGTNDASAIDFIYKVISQWPTLVVSSLLILTIVVGESRIETYRSQNKNAILIGKNEIKKTSFFIKIVIVWVLFVLALLLIFFLLLFK